MTLSPNPKLKLLSNISLPDKYSKTKVYYRICETKFKLWLCTSKEINESNIELSDKFLKIKDNNHSANIIW